MTHPDKKARYSDGFNRWRVHVNERTCSSQGSNLMLYQRCSKAAIPMTHCAMFPEELAMTLRTGLKVESLVLCDCGINDDGIAIVLDALLETDQIKHVRTFRIGGTKPENQIGCVGAQKLASVIPLMSNLEILNVDNNFISMDGFKALTEALMTPNAPMLHDILWVKQCIPQPELCRVYETYIMRLHTLKKRTDF